MDLSDSSAVVGEGNALICRALRAGAHLLLVDHTAAAMDDKGIGREILRKITAGGESKVQVLSGVVGEPLRELYGADVLALPVMGAAFRNQDRVAVREGDYFFCAFDGLCKCAL